MLVKGLRKDKDIVEVDQTDIVRETRHYKVYYTCKLTRCITETKTQDLEAPLSLACDRSGFVTVMFIGLSLPVSPMEVAAAKVLTAVEGVQTGIDLGSRNLSFL